jgi:hypothetical protein
MLDADLAFLYGVETRCLAELYDEVERTRRDALAGATGASAT